MMQDVHRKVRIAMAKAAFNKARTPCTRKLDLNFREKLVTCYISIIALFGAETWTLWKVYQKYLESSKMWCGRKIEIGCTEIVRNEEKLQLRSRGISKKNKKEG